MKSQKVHSVIICKESILFRFVIPIIFERNVFFGKRFRFYVSHLNRHIVVAHTITRDQFCPNYKIKCMLLSRDF